MNNKGRSWSGSPAVPYYPGKPHHEAAKHLASTARRYAKDTATLSDVENAMVELRRVAPVAGDQARKR